MKQYCGWTAVVECTEAAVRWWVQCFDSLWPSIVSKCCLSVGDDTTADKLVREEAACWAVSHVNLDCSKTASLWGRTEWGYRQQDDKISHHAEKDTAGMPGMSDWITHRHHTCRRTLIMVFKQEWLDWRLWWMLFSSHVHNDCIHAKEILQNDNVASKYFWQ